MDHRCAQLEISESVALENCDATRVNYGKVAFVGEGSKTGNVLRDILGDAETEVSKVGSSRHWHAGVVFKG